MKHKNPFGDFVTGTLGGCLCAYLLVGAVLVLFTGKALALGPALPIEPVPGLGPFLLLTVRLVQAIYHVGLVCMAFLGFRFLQELLRGHAPIAAAREAMLLPRFGL